MTLVILAAGLGSRFKDGLKQLAKVGPNGETIMELSIKDAKEIGFNKVVFIIRKELQAAFEEEIIPKIDMDYAFAYQEDSNIEGRVKPLGTGHALLALKGVVDDNFAVINADDYYGFNSLKELYDKFNSDVAIVAFELKNTVFNDHPVNRGICEIENDKLVDIKETSNIIKKDNKFYKEDMELDPNTYISMNLWGFKPEILTYFQDEFESFKNNMIDPLKDEFLIPNVVFKMIKEGRPVQVLYSADKCLGITYKEDMELFKK